MMLAGVKASMTLPRTQHSAVEDSSAPQVWDVIGTTGSQHAASTTDASSALPDPVSRFVSIGIDLVGMAKELDREAREARNRSAFVKNTCNIAMHHSKYRLNVMVFNLQQDARYHLKGVQAYRSVNYGGKTYGVWVFSSGWFVNQGHGTFDNWCFNGEYSRSGKRGKTVHFW